MPFLVLEKKQKVKRRLIFCFLQPPPPSKKKNKKHTVAFSLNPLLFFPAFDFSKSTFAIIQGGALLNER